MRDFVARQNTIKTLIIASGHTVAEVAEHLGLSEKTYYSMLQVVNIQNNNKIIYDTADYIGVDLSFLVLENDKGRIFRK